MIGWQGMSVRHKLTCIWTEPFILCLNPAVLFILSSCPLEASWNVMAYAQKSDFFFWRNGRVHLNRRGHVLSRILAAEVCASAVVMLYTPCSEVVWRVLFANSIRQFALHFLSRASPCAIAFQLESTCTAGRQALCSYASSKTDITRCGGTDRQNVHVWNRLRIVVSTEDRTYHRCCPVSAWIRVRCLEGVRKCDGYAV